MAIAALCDLEIDPVVARDGCYYLENTQKTVSFYVLE